MAPPLVMSRSLSLDVTEECLEEHVSSVREFERAGEGRSVTGGNALHGGQLSPGLAQGTGGRRVGQQDLSRIAVGLGRVGSRLLPDQGL